MEDHSTIRRNKERSIHIGINYGGTSSELNGCVSDSINMLRLSTELGIQDIVLMVDIDVNNASLLQRKTTEESKKVLESLLDSEPTNHNLKLVHPTKSNILNQIKLAVSDDSISSVFLTYSGHGTRGDYHFWNTEEKDRRDEYFCTLDDDGTYKSKLSSFVSDDELFGAIDEATYDRTNPLVITFVFDCCHSGTIFDLIHGMHSIRNKVIFKAHPNSSRELDSKLVTINGWSGSQDRQYSYENYNHESSMTEGYCTRSFIQAVESLVLNTDNTEVNHMDLHIEIMKLLFAIDDVDDNEINTTEDYQIPNYSSNQNIGLIQDNNIYMPIWVVGKTNEIGSVLKNKIHRNLSADKYEQLVITDEDHNDQNGDDADEELVDIDLSQDDNMSNSLNNSPTYPSDSPEQNTENIEEQNGCCSKNCCVIM